MNPGFYPSLSPDKYHEIKALSAGGIAVLDGECPRRFWLDSPWNGQRKAEHKHVFDVGTGAHLAVLEPEAFAGRVVEVPYDSYRTKAAQELRDAAYAGGMVPLTQGEVFTVQSIRNAILQSEAAEYFSEGCAESSLVWEWDGVLCKARPDNMIRKRGLLVDLKTTPSANPRAIARKAFGEYWPARVCWYKEAFAHLDRRPPRYIFVVVETKPPHLIQLFELDDRAEAWGQQIVRRGLTLFRQCMAKGEWPAYGEGVQKLGLPAWAEYGLADREAAGEFSETDIERGMEYLRP